MSSGTLVRRILVVVLGAAATFCIGTAVESDDSVPEPRAGHSLVTPLWSTRRVPQAVIDAVGAQRLASQVTAALGGVDSCIIVEDRGHPLVAANADRPLIPASTQKILTASAALQTLGPRFRYRTTAVASAKPVNGTADRLWLVGAGDPVLSTPERIAAQAKSSLTKTDVTTPLARLADLIQAQGIRDIPGGVWGDDSRYETTRALPTWPASYRSEVGPLGALAVDDGFDRTTGVPVADPALHAASELTRLLAARGVTVGPPGRGSAPGRTVEVAALASPPLQEILASALRSSDNFTMELVIRELGKHEGRQGTTAAGTQATVAALAKLGLPTNGLTLIDGSGLDKGDRATCALLLATLGRTKVEPFRSVDAGLPVAGESGTLAKRFVGTPLQGKLRAKTGSLNGATGLVGFLEVSRPLAFAFVANGGFSETTGIALRERIATMLSRYPDAPSADVLVPAPAAP